MHSEQPIMKSGGEITLAVKVRLFGMRGQVLAAENKSCGAEKSHLFWFPSKGKSAHPLLLTNSLTAPFINKEAALQTFSPFYPHSGLFLFLWRFE